MNLSSLIATLGYYPLPPGGGLPIVGGGGVPVDIRREEHMAKPSVIVRKLESTEIGSDKCEATISVVSVKSI